MQRLLNGWQGGQGTQALPAGGSRTLPAAAALLAPLGPHRRSQDGIVCRARKPRAELPGAAASAGQATPAAAAARLARASQQHAQPPRDSAQVEHMLQHQAALSGRMRPAAASNGAAGQQPQAAARGRPPGRPSTEQQQQQQLRALHQQQQQQGQQQFRPPQQATSATQPPSLPPERGQPARAQPAQQQPGFQQPGMPPVQPGSVQQQQQQQQQQEEGSVQPDAQQQLPAVETIFRLERRGEGWGEEILPHLVVEQRPIEKRKKRAYSRPDPWKEGSLECYLVELGLPPEEVDNVVTQAVAWRVTPGGRSLIDRRRRSRVERNVRLVVEHLELECGVPFGPKGIGAILGRCPELMLCKPTTNDRWDRRAVELAAYLLRHGHCNVPEDWPENPELGLWVKRQRIARAAGQLSEERLSILQSMGFAFGEVAQLTEEWEHRFDQLVDWLLWHNENSQPFAWLGVDWGERGGITARELALWITLQREYRARGLLPGEALSRFEALGVQWDCTDGSPAEREWMTWFGRLLYVIERHNSLTPMVRGSVGPALPSLPGRPPKIGRPRGRTAAGAGYDREGEYSGYGLTDGEDSEDEEEAGRAGTAGGGRGARGRGSAAVAAARLRLQAEVAARRAALLAADLRSEPGLRFWLARQRRQWRRQELPAELELLLQLAGVQLDPYTPAEWQATAHAAAGLLQGSRLQLGPKGVHPAALVQTAAALRVGQRPPQRAQQAAAEQQQQQQQGAQPDDGATPAEELGAAAAVGTALPALPACSSGEGSNRLRVARWVQTQQALFAQGKLSSAQLRYMAFLGITWVLSEQVVHMAWPVWQQRCAALAALPQLFDEPRLRREQPQLWEWLQHQRGLAALGWLPARRRAALEALQVDWAAFDRCPADDEWDLRLGELLAFKAEHGHCQLAGLPPALQAQWAGLAAWLAEQAAAAAAGLLPAPRAAQLAAIGALPAAAAQQAGPQPQTSQQVQVAAQQAG